MARQRYAGGCHCGNIGVRFHSDKTPAELGLRTDTCSFCNKHQARYASDPQGSVELELGVESRVERYRFGTKTADFLVCKVCGVFVAAYMAEPRPGLAVINVNALEARDDFLANPLQMADFDGETLEQRLARRRARWTPVVFVDQRQDPAAAAGK